MASFNSYQGQRIRTPWIPPEMTHAPSLREGGSIAGVEPRYALLINPFYAKDPNASFGKHVLTPSLAMTSFAATTPGNWRVEYWDENLLQGGRHAIRCLKSSGSRSI
jgi:hypothetical protein